MLQLDGGSNLTAWTCDRAAANHSRANCSECTWWKQPDLLQNANKRISTKAPTIAWFMCLQKPKTSREELSFPECAGRGPWSAR